ncbi:hypothetical protein KAR91_25080 [Candidatus Pacearchaeota archaeon]|nr:hypothetical protein [Candidatus Pacearchaeota archaeon]
MGSVADLSEYKKRKEDEGEYVWACDDCGNDVFFLTGSGSVECSNCGEVIRNLTVMEDKQ